MSDVQISVGDHVYCTVPWTPTQHNPEAHAQQPACPPRVCLCRCIVSYVNEDNTLDLVIDLHYNSASCRRDHPYVNTDAELCQVDRAHVLLPTVEGEGEEVNAASIYNEDVLSACIRECNRYKHEGNTLFAQQEYSGATVQYNRALAILQEIEVAVDAQEAVGVPSYSVGQTLLYNHHMGDSSVLSLPRPSHGGDGDANDDRLDTALVWEHGRGLRSLTRVCVAYVDEDDNTVEIMHDQDDDGEGDGDGSDDGHVVNVKSSIDTSERDDEVLPLGTRVLRVCPHNRVWRLWLILEDLRCAIHLNVSRALYKAYGQECCQYTWWLCTWVARTQPSRTAAFYLRAKSGIHKNDFAGARRDIKRVLTDDNADTQSKKDARALYEVLKKKETFEKKQSKKLMSSVFQYLDSINVTNNL
eukprot:GFYU01000575.1.p1 GENE.GFYU01000575.1~~GFYU01000575.1.p1  ORF type:complete len:414 (-),score=100.33 GFYU01000575.1:304-1545(-)